MALAAVVDVLQDRRLFRGGRALHEVRDGLRSGIAALDAVLPWGGYPRNALTELLHADPGIGEISLLLPVLRQLLHSQPVVLVNPPYLPYAPALAQAGLPLQRLLWIAATGERTLWASEQCLRAGCLGAVLLWYDRGDDRALRRLQMAAEHGATAAFLFRPLRHRANPSPAALRLIVERESLHLLKCRGAVGAAHAAIARPRA